MTITPAEPRSVRISSTDHRVEVIAEDRPDVSLTGSARLHQGDDGAITIDEVRSRIEVRVPSGVDVVVGTTSARVEVVGRVGDTAVVTQSGRVFVEHAAALDARTDSARVEIGRVDRGCRIRTDSGKVQVGACGDADVATTSGRIELVGVSGTVKSHCVSGRIEIEMISPHDVDAETVSGRVSVSLPAGVRIHRPGEADVASASGAFDCTVNARSVSGRVEVSSR